MNAEEDALALAYVKKVQEFLGPHMSLTQIHSSFIINKTLGLGTFGRVRLAKFTEQAEKDFIQRNKNQAGEECLAPGCFALKIMKKSEILRLKQLEHVECERKLLYKCEHPFIVKMFTTWKDDRNLYLLQEFVQGGELGTHLRSEGTFTNEAARFFAAQLVMAVQYLHSEDTVFRGLVPENLLIDRKGYLKLVDFGYAKTVPDKTWTLCGTPEYLAPEIIQSKGHSKGVDWWALGILMYEMLAGYPPFYAESPFEIYQKILACHLEFANHFDDNAKDLLDRLLRPDKAKRIGCLKSGAEDIKKHKWFRGLNWAALYNKNMEVKEVIKWFKIDENTPEDDISAFEEYPDSVEESGPLLEKSKDEKFNFYTNDLEQCHHS